MTRPEDIQRAACAAFGFSAAELCGSWRHAPLVMVRHGAMYLIRKRCGLSLAEIGRLFGGRDHTVVRHGTRRIERLLAESSPKGDAARAAVTAIADHLADRSCRPVNVEFLGLRRDRREHDRDTRRAIALKSLEARCRAAPLVRETFALLALNPHRLQHIAAKSGVRWATVMSWGKSRGPQLANIEAVLNAAGYQLAIVPLEKKVAADEAA